MNDWVQADSPAGHQFQAFKKRIGNIRFPTLHGTSDFPSWKESVEVAVNQAKITGFLDGSTPYRKDSSETVKNVWKDCNSWLYGTIYSSLSSTIRRRITRPSTFSAADLFQAVTRLVSERPCITRRLLLNDLISLHFPPNQNKSCLECVLSLYYELRKTSPALPDTMFFDVVIT